MRLLLIVLLASSLMAPILEALPLFKETEHFMLFCMPPDHSVAETMLNEAENFYMHLAKDFKGEFSTKIIMNIYPDLLTFHQAIGWPTAPDWVIGDDHHNIINNVSPNNPGPVHTYQSVMKSNKVGLVTVFVSDKFPTNFIPRWLHQGVALYKAQFLSDGVNKRLRQNISALPTFEELESIEEDDIRFEQIKGFAISYSVVQFIEQKWGWDSILALLADYAKFEEILKVSKQELWSQWIRYLHNNELE
jgi:RNA polymerase sigma-70 factor, ECF subfamily